MVMTKQEANVELTKMRKARGVKRSFRFGRRVTVRVARPGRSRRGRGPAGRSRRR